MLSAFCNCLLPTNLKIVNLNLEHAYEAVLDAGINPKSLRGSRTGVFIGACFAESEKTWFYEKVSTGGFGITG